MDDIYFFENLDQIHAIGEPTRWYMLDLLIANPMTGSQLARALGIPRPLAHYHLKILEKVGLVELLEKRLLGGVVENYYRAIARQFRTDNLVDCYRSTGDQENGTALQTGEAVRELMKAMIEVAKADLSQPNTVSSLSKMGFNYQDDVHLSLDQVNEFIRTLRALGDRYVQLSNQNRAELSESELQNLIRLRYTWLMTPVATIKSTQPQDSVRKRKKTN